MLNIFGKGEGILVSSMYETINLVQSRKNEIRIDKSLIQAPKDFVVG